MAPVSITQQARLLVGLAIAGAVPLTVGAILWLVGTVMASVYHGKWNGTAGIGGVLLLIGLICGLVLFVLAAVGERRTMPEPWGQSRTDPPGLTPLASPEQQAFLADPPPPAPFPAEPSFPAGPPSQPFPAVPAPGPPTPGPPKQGPPAAGYPPPYLAEPPFPPDEQWPDPDPPPPYPAFPADDQR
jgi:hypothetical protein